MEKLRDPVQRCPKTQNHPPHPPPDPPHLSCLPPPPCTRYGVSPGYLPLPMARVKAAGIDPKSKPATAAMLAATAPIGDVVRAAALCEKALARAGTAQSQSLFEAYARLQQLLGKAVAVPQVGRVGGRHGHSSCLARL